MYLSVGTGKLESTLVPKHGFRFLPISVAGFPRRITLEWFPVIWKAFRGLTQSLQYMTQLKPDIVIGTGGYVSGPVLLAALLRRIPIVIQEQNASVGLTNRVLARWAKAVYLAMASAGEHSAFRHTKHIRGNWKSDPSSHRRISEKVTKPIKNSGYRQS